MDTAPLPTAPDDTGWNLPLIGTKMNPPRLPRGWVQRSAGQAATLAPVQRGLTLVVAPAGFGKTTLLAEWCLRLRNAGEVVAWVSLDAEDDDLQQFGAYVLTALRHASAGAIYRAHELLRQDPLTPVKTVISVLLNELAASPCRVFLVLDDFDRLHQPAITETLVRLLRYAPDHFHVLMGGRTEPALGLGELRAREQLLRLDEDSLRFSAEEAGRFLAQATGRPMPPQGVAQLHQATEGWVAGLQLAALALREGGGAGDAVQGLAAARRGIDAYLEDAVLSRLPAPVYGFLLRSAVLDRFCAPFCDAVMAWPDGPASARMLDWLERHHVFLRHLQPPGTEPPGLPGPDSPGAAAAAPAAEAPWFRYHALLADALCRRLAREHPQELPGLHRRAAEWLAGQGLWAEAVRHALAGGDLARAADWVEQQANAWVDHSDVRSLLGWIQRLPPELRRQRPRLQLAHAWALALSLQTAAASQALAGLEPPPPEAARPDAAWQAECVAVRALIAGLADRSADSLDLGREAAQRLAEVQAAGGRVPAWVQRFAETATWFGAMYEGEAAMHAAPPATPLPWAGVPLRARQEPVYASVYRESMFGLAAWVAGRLGEAVTRFEAALAHAEAAVGRDSAAAVLPAGYLAGLRHERGDTPAAQALMAGRLGTALQGCALGSLLRLGRAHAGALERAGDLPGALGWLAELRELARERAWPRLHAGVDAEAVRLLLRAGQLDEAERLARHLTAWLDQAPAHPPGRPGSALETWGFHQTLQARLELARQQPGQAGERLAAAQERLQAAGLRAQAGSIALLHAVARQTQGQDEAARAVLLGVLPWLGREQVLAPVVDEGPVLRTALRGLCRHSRAAAPRAVAEWLLGQAPALPPAAAVAPQPACIGGAPVGVLFSHRERDILQHMVQGLSNKEIGRALGVAPETVKWHLKNVFGKLDVGSRAEAVLRLRQAGWPPA